ncbi:hypothetical protein MIR68_002054 [Amoeboaphelidium protococcarum]|nr:hypothetical protein MIR68_002054 [Amoeboaphelidium protococcarum]
MCLSSCLEEEKWKDDICYSDNERLDGILAFARLSLTIYGLFDILQNFINVVVWQKEQQDGPQKVRLLFSHRSCWQWNEENVSPWDNEELGACLVFSIKISLNPFRGEIALLTRLIDQFKQLCKVDEKIVPTMWSCYNDGYKNMKVFWKSKDDDDGQLLPWISAHYKVAMDWKDLKQDQVLVANVVLKGYHIKKDTTKKVIVTDKISGPCYVFLKDDRKLQSEWSNTTLLSKKKSRDYWNATRKQAKPLEVGTVVFVLDVNQESKWDAMYEGPYEIVGIDGKKAYVLKDEMGAVLNRHVPREHLKVRSQKFADLSVLEVESIQDHRGSERDGFEYLVRWKKLDASEDSWEHQKNFNDWKVIQRYWKSRSAAGVQPVAGNTRMKTQQN